MIVGGPAGALISYFSGWRSGFWGVVVLTAIGAVLVFLAMPETSTREEPSMKAELGAMRRPQLWCVYAVTLLSTAAYMVSFNYLAALLTRVTGILGGWVPAILALFGIGAFIGLSIGGRIADKMPYHTLLIGAIGMHICSVLLALFAEHGVVVIPLVALLGISGFILNPAIYGRVFAIASDAPTLAGATTVSAFQLGISLVPVLAGWRLTRGAGLAAVAWIGAELGAATIPVVLLDRAMHRWPRIEATVTSAQS